MISLGLITQKGGSGKTTAAFNLATEATAQGLKVLLVDTDNQGSLANWYQARPEELEQPKLVTIEPMEASKAIEAARGNGFDVVIFDTPGRDAPGLRAVVNACDFCLVPCRPTVGDLQASVATVMTIKEAAKPFAFLLSQTMAKTGRTGQATTTLKQLGATCPTSIVSRVAYPDAQISGLGVNEYEPGGKAATEIASIWTWLTKQLASKI